MTFKEILHDVVTWIRKDGKVSYRAIKRQFDEVDDEYLEDLRHAILYAYPVTDEGEGLRWKNQDITPEPTPVEIGNDTNTYGLQAERRRITVMFCDLADSTPLSQMLDPEHLMEVIRAYQQAAASIIHKYEGYVAQYLGDGLLVYFGWPRAHENDTERALLTGLEVVKSIVEILNPKLRAHYNVELSVRIGVHAGLVVVGQMGGDGRFENLATGDTVNIAARIEGLADPNSVMISDATHKLVSGKFALEDRGITRLKGVTADMRLYKVLGNVQIHGDLPGEKVAAGTFLVGRDEEIGLLHRRWEQAKRGLGQIVHISGAAGIGKSGLVESMRAEVKNAEYPCLVIRCSAYHQNSSYFPLTSALAHQIELNGSEEDPGQLQNLEQYIDSIGLPRENTVPFLCKLLSIDAGDAYPDNRSITPQKQKQLTSDAMLSWLFNLAQQRPLLLIWEDLHWADPSTLEVTANLIQQIPTVPMLSVLTYRPEFIPHWRQHSHITPIVLSRLELAQTRALISHHANYTELPAEVVEHIVNKTDGVPLFIEELTKMLIDSGILKLVQDKFELSGPLTSLTIPDTLQDSLMARLDQLNKAKKVAQFGSVIGREFSYESILSIYEGSKDSLNDGLEKLLSAELLYIRGRIPEAVYTFKHALLQDAAYDTLLKSKRQQIHLAIGKYLESNPANNISNQPEIIAHHYTEGQDYNRALEYWLKAGRLSKSNSSHFEAIAHLQRGLQIVGKLNDDARRLDIELDLELALGPSLIATKGFAYTGVGESFVRAKELASELGDVERMYGAYWGLLSHHTVRSNHLEGRQTGIGLAKLPKDGFEDLYILPCTALGISSYSLSEFQLSVSQFEPGIESYRREHHERHIGLCGMDMGVFGLSSGSHSAWQTGQIDKALTWSNRALNIAEELAHPFTRSVSRAYAAMLSQFTLDIDRTQELAISAIALTDEQQFPYYLAWSRIIHGWCMGIQGNFQGGMNQIVDGLSILNDTGSLRALPYYYSLQAEIEAVSGNLNRAMIMLNRGLQTADEINEHWWVSELYRLKGDFLIADSEENIEEAHASYQNAIDICEKQGAKTLHLRAAVSLAKLLSKTNQQHLSIDLLKPILESFDEGLDSQDVKAARRMLKDLQAA